MYQTVQEPIACSSVELSGRQPDLHAVAEADALCLISRLALLKLMYAPLLIHIAVRGRHANRSTNAAAYIVRYSSLLTNHTTLHNKADETLVLTPVGLTAKCIDASAQP